MISQYQIGPAAPNGSTAQQFDGPICGVRVVPLGQGPASAELASRYPSIAFDGGQRLVLVGPVCQTADEGRAWDRLIVTVPEGLALVEIADTPEAAARLALQSQAPGVVFGLNANVARPVDALSAGIASDPGAALRTSRRGVLLYDSGVVAGGVAIDSGGLNCEAFANVAIRAINSDPVNARLLNFTAYTEGACVSAYETGITLATVAAAGTHRAALGDYASNASNTAAGVPLGMRFILVAAGGAAAGRLVIWGR